MSIILATLAKRASNLELQLHMYTGVTQRAGNTNANLKLKLMLMPRLHTISSSGQPLSRAHRSTCGVVNCGGTARQYYASYKVSALYLLYAPSIQRTNRMNNKHAALPGIICLGSITRRARCVTQNNLLAIIVMHTVLEFKYYAPREMGTTSAASITSTIHIHDALP
jgi:hypothetical protein